MGSGGWEGYGCADGPDADQDHHHHQLCCLRQYRVHYGSPSVQGDGQHGEHAGGYSGEGDELVDGAVGRAKVPGSVEEIISNLLFYIYHWFTFPSYR